MPHGRHRLRKFGPEIRAVQQGIVLLRVRPKSDLVLSQRIGWYGSNVHR